MFIRFIKKINIKNIFIQFIHIDMFLFVYSFKLNFYTSLSKIFFSPTYLNKSLKPKITHRFFLIY